mmetsp:Transcript_61066/g.154160  ORF Transcript_61066/g.154160 Transcript_61066/m.154160 type:complete len:349 (-) Transcript_61066:503-1549(-)
MTSGAALAVDAARVDGTNPGADGLAVRNGVLCPSLGLSLGERNTTGPAPWSTTGGRLVGESVWNLTTLAGLLSLLDTRGDGVQRLGAGWLSSGEEEVVLQESSRLTLRLGGGDGVLCCEEESPRRGRREDISGEPGSDRAHVTGSTTPSSKAMDGELGQALDNLLPGDARGAPAKLSRGAATSLGETCGEGKACNGSLGSCALLMVNVPRACNNGEAFEAPIVPLEKMPLAALSGGGGGSCPGNLPAEHCNDNLDGEGCIEEVAVVGAKAGDRATACIAGCDALSSLRVGATAAVVNTEGPPQCSEVAMPSGMARPQALPAQLLPVLSGTNALDPDPGSTTSSEGTWR